jgi:hypothetical protein
MITSWKDGYIIQIQKFTVPSGSTMLHIRRNIGDRLGISSDSICMRDLHSKKDIADFMLGLRTYKDMDIWISSKIIGG